MNLEQISISFSFIVLLYYYGFFDKEIQEWVNIEKTKKEISMPPNGMKLASLVFLINLIFILFITFKFEKYWLYPGILLVIFSFEWSKDKNISTKVLAIIASMLCWLIFII